MAKNVKSESQIEVARRLQNTPWCEEYELMISGMLFNSFVPKLANARFAARKWQHDYNTSFPKDAVDADSLQQSRLQELRSIIGHLGGEDIYVEPPFHFDYGCNMSIGDRFYSNFGLTVIDGALVTIGDRVMLGPNVSIFTASHETEVQSRRDNIEYNLPVTIGDDCWVGGHVVILPGVTIGEGCTIGASSVVSRDIPPWSVAIGSPARVVKKVAALKPLSKDS